MPTPSGQPSKKLRSSCDECHNSKSRCSGETPCQNCARLSLTCYYGPSNRMGRPRGTKNKKTPARLSSSNESISTATKDRTEGSQDISTPSLSYHSTPIDTDLQAILSAIPGLTPTDSDNNFNSQFQLASMQHSTPEDMSAMSI